MHVAGLQELGRRLKAEGERQRVLEAEFDSASQAVQAGNQQLRSLDEQIEILRAQLNDLEATRGTLLEQQPELSERATDAKRAHRENLKIREGLEHQEPELASLKTVA